MGSGGVLTVSGGFSGRGPGEGLNRTGENKAA